jgi:adenylosuccinate synthase
MNTRVTLIAGLGFGDEGKGTTVDWLARRTNAKLVVRYNGGAQAAHNVVSGERHHTFAQFGSATFAGVPTLLSRHVLVNPIALLAEARHLDAVGVASALSLVHVEGDALVTTPLHVAMNRLREMSRTGRHGSCGMGIGETMSRALERPDEALRIADLARPAVLREKLALLRGRVASELGALSVAPSSSERRERAIIEEAETIDACMREYDSFSRSVEVVSREWLSEQLRAGGDFVFEGAQGVLLDQDFGFQPHTTWTDITFRNALDLVGGVDAAVTRIGVLRAYATRHGAGPFVTEDASWDTLSAHDHNTLGEWQGAFRSGALDLVSARYALDVLHGADGLVVTNVDRLKIVGDRVPVCVAYENASDERFFDARDRIRVVRPIDLAHQEALTVALGHVRPAFEPFERAGYARAVAARLGVPLFATSFGPRATDKVLAAQRAKAPISCKSRSLSRANRSP